MEICRQPPLLTDVRLKNYKSIAKCDVALGRLNLIVGRNGAGKSNFLDALRFVLDSLQETLDHAIRSRGGIDEVRRRSTGHPHNFGIRLGLALDHRTAVYDFEVASRGKGGFVVKYERLRVDDAHGRAIARYECKEGQVVDSNLSNAMPPAAPDRLYLVNASGLPEFRPVYDALSSMGFYNLNPERMKEIQPPDPAEFLRRDGSNLASIVAKLCDGRDDLRRRLTEYLETIVEGLVGFKREAFGSRETIVFKQRVQGADHPWSFHASSMSDGTLRSFGILVAVLQLARHDRPIRLVGIEEPETALHPAAAANLMSAIREATIGTQVLLTTHSPELLDGIDLSLDRLVVVQSDQGTTQIGEADAASIESIKTSLYSPGELLRMDQLTVDGASLMRQREFDYEGTTTREEA